LLTKQRTVYLVDEELEVTIGVADHLELLRSEFEVFLSGGHKAIASRIKWHLAVPYRAFSSEAKANKFIKTEKESRQMLAALKAQLCCDSPTRHIFGR